MMAFVDGDRVLPACSKMSLANVTMANMPVDTCIVNNKKHTENALKVGGEVTENGYRHYVCLVIEMLQI